MRRRDFLMALGGTLGAIAGASRVRGEQAAGTAVPSVAFGPWGFDTAGADPATRPGDDFFRHCNGTWYDRAVIASDQAVSSIDQVLRDTAETRIRAILEQRAEGVEPSARADAAKIGTFYANFMDEARAEALDASPIATHLQTIRNLETRSDLAALMGAANHTFFSSIFGTGIGIDAKAPDRYAVLVNQSGLGLPDRDYYLTAQFADKKAAYLAYVEQMLSLIGWPAPQACAAAILDYESAIAEVSWTAADSRNSDKTYNPTTVAELAKTAPFAWRDFAKAARLESVDRVVLGEVTAIPRIAAIYDRTAIETLKAWQAFNVVELGRPACRSVLTTPIFNSEAARCRAWPNSRRAGSGACGPSAPPWERRSDASTWRAISRPRRRRRSTPWSPTSALRSKAASSASPG